MSPRNRFVLFLKVRDVRSRLCNQPVYSGYGRYDFESTKYRIRWQIFLEMSRYRIDNRLGSNRYKWASNFFLFSIYFLLFVWSNEVTISKVMQSESQRRLAKKLSEFDLGRDGCIAFCYCFSVCCIFRKNQFVEAKQFNVQRWLFYLNGFRMVNGSRWVSGFTCVFLANDPEWIFWKLVFDWTNVPLAVHGELRSCW